jgi:uncharacterized protein
VVERWGHLKQKKGVTMRSRLFRQLAVAVLLCLGLTGGRGGVVAQDQADEEVVSGAVFDPNPTNDSYPGTSQYIDYVVQHADTVWTNWFEDNGLNEPYVYRYDVFEGQSFTQKCTDKNGDQVVVVWNTNNAYYCGLDVVYVDGVTYQGVMYFPIDTMLQLKSGDIFDDQSSYPGDFALAMVVAHEFGHHIQDELRIQMGWAEISSGVNKELIADCFSGIWASAAYKDSLLETGDVEEAIAALDTLGSETHGTAEQRKNAWLIGYSGSQDNPKPGVPKNCIDAYWT